MKNRRKFRQACGGKKTKYPSKIIAAQAAFILSNRLNNIITSYFCRYCGNWHVGHPPKQIREMVLERQAAAYGLRKRAQETKRIQIVK